MKHYYLINNQVNVSDSKMPKRQNYKLKITFEASYNDWKDSLQPCEIDESELEKIINYTLLNGEKGTIYKDGVLIDITDIIEDNNGVITFKQPTEKQVESECELVECNDENIDIFINKYINDLPKSWRSDLDMYLSMKNAMLEALSYPKKYTIKRNI